MKHDKVITFAQIFYCSRASHEDHACCLPWNETIPEPVLYIIQGQANEVEANILRKKLFLHY